MDLFLTGVFRWVLATLLLCSIIQKSESAFKLSQKPSNPTIVVLGVNSSDVKLDWQFSGAPQNYLVQIFKQKPGGTLEQITASKDGNAFIPSNTKDFVASLDAQLKLKNVGKDDEYTYSIILSNSVPAQEDSHAVSIIVVVPPEITLPRPDPRPFLTIGKNYTLTCNASGDPLPKITWTKDGIPAEEFNVTGHKLHLTNVKLKDVGSYRCTASNGYGVDASNVSIAGIKCSECESKTVGITLESETWKSALNNRESIEFKTLQANLLSEISKVYTKSPGKELYTVGVVDFRSGSVIAKVEMEFGKSVTDPLKPLEDEIKGGKLGAFRVKSELDLYPTTLPPTFSSSKTSEKPEGPSAGARTSKLTQSELWGIIGGCIAFFLVVIIIIVVSCICCRKKKSGGASKGGRNQYSEADGYRMNKQPPSGLGTASPAYVEARQYAPVSSAMRQDEQRKGPNYMEPAFGNSPASYKQPPPYSATEYSEIASQKGGQQGEGGGFELWC